MTENVISFSGGRTSAYMAKLIKEKYPDAISVFLDTGAEHPKTYEFVKKVNKAFNLNLICLKAKINQTKGIGVTYEQIDIDSIGWDLSMWNDFIKKYKHPNAASAPHCTDRLKLQSFEKYLKKLIKEKKLAKNYFRWLGIRSDEPRRLRKKDGYKYLADISDFDKQDVLDFWKTQPFDLEIKEHLGNCVFCIKKSAKKIALAIKEEPQLYKEFKDTINKYENTYKTKEGVTFNSNTMYRNYQSLESIEIQFIDMEKKDLEEYIYKSKADDSECSESCEIISAEENIDDIPCGTLDNFDEIFEKYFLDDNLTPRTIHWKI